MADLQNFQSLFKPLRSAPNELPVQQLADFYAALKHGDDDLIAARLLTLGKLAKVKTPSWQDFIASRPHFHFHVDVYDDQHKPFERGKWVGYRELDNLVTREGLGYLIGCGFAVTSPPTKKSNFYVTQSKASMAGVVTTDTASSHAGFGTEIAYSTDVSQSVRPTITFAATSTGADLTECDNSASQAVFNQLTSITLYGLGAVSVSSAGTSSGYTGDIWYGETAYATSLAVASGYQVNVTCEISATAG